MSATSPVQPVWCAAPRPAPLSPWKYSLKADVVPPLRVVLQPVDPAEARAAARPAPPVKIETSRPRRSSAMLGERAACCPEPVGYSTVKSVAEEAGGTCRRQLDDQVVQREPDRPAPVGVAAEHAGGRLGGLVVDRRGDALEVQHVRLVAVARATGRAARTATGTLDSSKSVASIALERWAIPTTPTAGAAVPGRPGSGRPARGACRASARPCRSQEGSEPLAELERVVEHPLVDQRRPRAAGSSRPSTWP